MRSSEARSDGARLGTFWWRLFLFLSPCLVVYTLFEGGLRSVVTSHSAKRRILERRAGVETLVLGSSAAYYGVCPGEFPGGGVNLGNVSQSHYYDARLMRTVLPSLPRLRRVIVAVTYLSLGFRLEDSPEAWRQFYYRHYWGILPANARDGLDGRAWSRFALFTPPRSVVLALSGFDVRDAPAFDAHGCFGEFVRGHLDEDAVRARIAYHHSVMAPSAVDENLRFLDEIAAMAKQRRVGVVFVTPPVSGAYAARMDHLRWQQLKERVVALAGRTSSLYFDHLEDDRFSSPDFADPDHLNVMGAARFSRILAAEAEASVPRAARR